MLIRSGYREETAGMMDNWPDGVIKNEPMLFNCDLQHAFDLGGPITKQFIELLPAEFHNSEIVVDTRVHMLMPTWYPCIPGWHHDDVPRTRADGQPHYEDRNRTRSFHCITIVGSADCSTEFAVGTHSLPILPLGSRCYERYHNLVEELVNTGVFYSERILPRCLYLFNDESWHRGTASRNTGWRFFARASRYQDSLGNKIARGNPRTNEIRRQVQVYQDSIHAGW